MSKQWVCAVAVLGLGLGGGCQEQQAPHFIGTVGANVRLHIEQAYLSPGSSTRVTAVAYDADGKRGAGTVRLEAPAGRFAGGAQVELALVDGSVTTTYNCDEAVDPRCTGIVSLLASWGEQRTLSAVNLSYQVLGGGGMAGGGGGGGSGSGGGALASNGTGDPFEVYLDEMGLSSLAATDKVVVRPDTAYGVGFYGEVIRPTDGKLVYISEQLRTVHVFVPDELVYSASTQEWQLPASATSNDEPIATPGCSDVDSLRLRPGTGEVVFSCVGSDLYYDTSGKTVLGTTDRLLTLAPQTQMLVERRIDGVTAELMIGSGTTFKAVTGFPNLQFRAARWSRTGGWWVVSRVGTEPHLALWKVSEAGAATRVGTYPQDLSISGGQIMLDGDGDAYTLRILPGPGGDTEYGLVLRFEPDPQSEATVMASDLGASAPDFKASPPRLRNSVRSGHLYTGP